MKKWQIENLDTSEILLSFRFCPATKVKMNNMNKKINFDLKNIFYWLREQKKKK